ncbi:MAG: hypothetical protein JNL81_13735 [Hyphomonadaceae bacterium]|nr:hypothetical protein [Hyphomonadaceae bacterium]
MRFSIAAALLLALAACGNTEPSARDTIAPEVRDLRVNGDYKPSSNTARAITGGMVVQTGGLSFGNGAVLYTRTLNPRRGGDLLAKNGDSYAAAVVGPGALSVELRRVTEQVLPAGVVGLCGAERPEYVALAYDERATTITMLVFSGDEPPGPQAVNSRVCARFGYAAPDGARTREGVVL